MALATLTGAGDTTFNGYLWVKAPGWISVASNAFLVFGCGAFVLLGQKLGPRALWYQVITIGLMLNFAGPMGWTHYLIFPMLLLPGVLNGLNHRGGMLAIVVFALPFQLQLFTRLTDRELPELTSSIWGVFWQILALSALIVLALRTPKGQD